MSVAPVSIGDVAGVVAALSFAFLVLRLGSLIGKAGKVLGRGPDRRSRCFRADRPAALAGDRHRGVHQ